MRSRTTIRAAVVTTALTALAACGSSKTATPAATPTPSATPAGTSASVAATSGSPDLTGQTLTVYSGQHEETVALLEKDFETRTGAKVDVRSNDESSLAGQILQEGSASPADVFYAENPPALTTLDEKKLLEPVTPSTLAQVPSDVSDPAGDWVGVSARAAAFVANTSVPDSELPTSILDLAKPVWKGKVGIAPGETDFSPLIDTITKADGAAAAKTWLQGIKANAKLYDDNEGLVAAVNKGEVATGVIDHYYWYRLRDEVGAANVKCRIVNFAKGDPGNLVDVSGAAVLASSKHKDAAQAFLAYLVSDPAQQIIATSESYEYPLRPGVTSTKGLKPLSDIGPLTPVADLGDGKSALALLQDTGLL